MVNLLKFVWVLLLPSVSFGAYLSPTTIPLPTGASTSALQSTGNTSLSSIDTKTLAPVFDYLTIASGGGTTSYVYNSQGMATFYINTIGESALSAATFSIEGSTDNANWFSVFCLNKLLLDGNVNNILSGPQEMDCGVGGTKFVRLSGSVLSGPTFHIKVGLSPTVSSITGIMSTVYVGQTGVWNTRLQDGAGSAVNKGQGLMAASLPVTIASNQSSIPVTLAANQSTNVAQIAGVTPLMGNGVTGTGSQRVTIASDNTAFPVNATLSAETTKVIGTVNVSAGQSVTANSGTNLNTSLLSLDSTLTGGAQKTKIVDGANATVGPVTAFAGTNYFPVVLAATSTAGSAIPSRSIQVAGSDGTNSQNISVDTTGKVNINTVASVTGALPAGTNLLGKVGIDQTTPGTTNKVSIGTDGTVAATQSGTWNIGTVTTITNPLAVAAAASSSPIGAVSLGNSLGKTNVMKTGTLVTTATTADQVILTYTVTAGKTFYLEYFSSNARLTTFAATATYFGLTSLESPAATKLVSTMIAGSGLGDRDYLPFTEPIPIAAGTVIRIVTTPSAVTSMTWQGNLGGYEK